MVRGMLCRCMFKLWAAVCTCRCVWTPSFQGLEALVVVIRAPGGLLLRTPGSPPWPLYS